MTLKELKAMSNEELVRHFDYICTKLTHEVGCLKGQTKKTTTDWERTKAELLRRLNG